jgi:ABC-type bacteriocin/lantibiotic exporter with double-glycine peptidase domain
MKISQKNTVLRVVIALLFGVIGVVRLVAGDMQLGLIFVAVAVLFVVFGIIVPAARGGKTGRDV